MVVRRNSAVGEQPTDGTKKTTKGAKGAPVGAADSESAKKTTPAKATPRKATPTVKRATPTAGKATPAAGKATPAAGKSALAKKSAPAQKAPPAGKSAPAQNASPARKAPSTKKPPPTKPPQKAPAPDTAPDTALVRRARRINRELAEVYPYAHPELDFENPFQLVVATVLSAQTTDLRVNQTTPALFAKYPTPEDLAAANPEEVEEILRPTGFFRAKTKSVIGLSKALRDDFGGEVPGRLEDLVKLPGVGRKTAFVVLGNAFGFVA